MVFTPGMERTLAVRVESDGVGEFTGSMDDAIEALGGFEVAVGLAGGALAALSAGGLALATKAAADFEEQMVEVQKVTDETTAAALSDDIQELASTIPIAQSELAAITADAARFGIRGTENINAFTESVARMSVATDLSAQEAGEAFARLATLTRTPVSQMENLGSAINLLSNNFATSSQEIVDSMLRSSGALSQLGVQQTDIIALSAALNEVSESSERAGSRLRRLAQEMLEPKKQAELAEALGMTTEQFDQLVAEDPTGVIVRMAQAMAQGGETADRLNTVLGTESRTALAALGQNLDGVERALGESSKAFAEATSLQEEFEAATDTVNSRARVLRNRLGNLAITTGEGLLPVVSDLIGGLSFAVGGFNDFNESLNGLPAQITAVTGAAAGLGLMLSSFGIAAGGPVALAVAGIGALAIAWGHDFADIRSITSRSVDEIGEQLGRLNDDLSNNADAVEDNKSVWQDWGDFLSRDIGNKLDMLATGFTQLMTLLVGVQRAQAALQAGDIDRAQDISETTLEEVRSQGEALDMRQLNRENPVEETTGMASSIGEELSSMEVSVSSGDVSVSTPEQQRQQETLRRVLRQMAEMHGTTLTEATISRIVEDGKLTKQEMREAFGSALQNQFGSDGRTIGSDERVAAMLRKSTEAEVRRRRANDATEVPGRIGELARIAASGPGSPMGMESLKPGALIEVHATIEANNEEDVRDAGAVLGDELQSMNIVDTNTVVGR